MSNPNSSLINAVLMLLLIVITLMAVQVTDTLRARQQMALDLAEVKDVKYGLLNADVWVQQVTAIIDHCNHDRRAAFLRFSFSGGRDLLGRVER